MLSSGTWRNDWQRGLENPNPPPFAHFSSTCTRARGCSQQTKSWTTGLPRRWLDTGSSRIRIRGPRRTRTSPFPLQRLLLDWDLHGRQTGGGSQFTGRHLSHLQSGPGDLQARFHRNHSRGRSNRILNRKEGGNGWRNPSLA